MTDSVLHQWKRDVLIYAFRYTLGRSTYAPGIMQNVLRDEWPSMSYGDQQLIQKEIQEAYDRNQLGMEHIDAPGWMALLELPLKEE